jgi:hypothetical protein
MTRERLRHGSGTAQLHRAGTLSALLLLAGCASLAGLSGGGGDGGGEHAEGSTARDVTQDTVHDAGRDVLHDASRDATHDTGRDAIHDAGRDAIADAGHDAIRDAGRDVASDAGHVADATTDAAAGYCNALVPAPTFCEDFDEGSLSQGWTSQFNYGGGTLGLDTQVFVSPPASAHVVIPAEMGEDYGQAVLNLQFEQTFMTADVDFDYICSEVDDTTVLVVGWSSYTLNLAFNTTNVEVAEELNPSGSESNMWLFAQLPAGSPLHVSVTLSTVDTGTGGQIDVYFNHSATAAIEQALDSPPIASAVQFDFGAVYSQGAGWNANFDNIVVDLH